MNTRLQPRLSLAALGLSLALVATACGSGKNASAEIASLGTTDSGTAPTTTSPVDSQEALLKYAACMRENGVDMADPTFDADGNPTGGGFGPGSGIDPRSDEFQAAQTVCGDLLQGVTLGGRGRQVDREAIQNSLNDFTACLRDEGLQVDDVTFGPPAGGAAGDGAPTGSLPAGAGQGDGQGGGFGGPPPDGSVPDGGPGGAGFDPTARIIDRLGLDDSDPAVTAAVDKCQPILTEAFQPTTSTTAP